MCFCGNFYFKKKYCKCIKNSFLKNKDVGNICLIIIFLKNKLTPQITQKTCATPDLEFRANFFFVFDRLSFLKTIYSIIKNMPNFWQTEVYCQFTLFAQFNYNFKQFLSDKENRYEDVIQNYHCKKIFNDLNILKYNIINDCQKISVFKKNEIKKSLTQACHDLKTLKRFIYQFNTFYFNFEKEYFDYVYLLKKQNPSIKYPNCFHKFYSSEEFNNKQKKKVLNKIGIKKICLKDDNIFFTNQEIFVKIEYLNTKFVYGFFTVLTVFDVDNLKIKNYTSNFLQKNKKISKNMSLLNFYYNNLSI